MIAAVTADVVVAGVAVVAVGSDDVIGCSVVNVDSVADAAFVADLPAAAAAAVTTVSCEVVGYSRCFRFRHCHCRRRRHCFRCCQIVGGSSQFGIRSLTATAVV